MKFHSEAHNISKHQTITEPSHVHVKAHQDDLKASKRLPFLLTGEDGPKDLMTILHFIEYSRYMQYYINEASFSEQCQAPFANYPAAAALLSKMGYTDDEKVQVKKEFLKMLVEMEMLKKGSSIDFIAEVTGLDHEEIEAMKARL